jgi:circadian clock protein KaiC
MSVSPCLLLASGVPGLDELLGGGIPETSLTLIGGGAGSGKTTLALQLAFANAAADRPALYFCGPAEPSERLEEHAAPLKFFNAARLGTEVQLIDLGAHFSERDSSRVLDKIAREVAATEPGLIVVDLPRALTPPALWSEMLQFLMYRLVTAVVVADGPRLEPGLEATLSAADNAIWLEPGQRSRTVEVLKVRGQTPMPGKHALQLGCEGMRVFPRWPTPWRARVRSGPERLATGVEGIDSLLGGGVRAGGSVLVEGASGTGKTVLATQFLAECGHQGSPALAVLVEERADRFVARAEAMDLQLDRLIQGGLVQLHSVRGRDVSGDELSQLVQRAVLGLGARSVVIDSVGGLDLVVEDVRDFVWRAVDALCGAGVTVWLNALCAFKLRTLVDDVLSLTWSDGQRRVEVVKSSALVTGSHTAGFHIGARGIETQAWEKVRPTSNGHVVGLSLSA